MTKDGKKRQASPKISPLMYWGFERYVTRMARKHFNSVKVCLDNLEELRSAGPLVVFANHPGWWDPLMAVLLRRYVFSNHRLFAPMDAEALRAYPVLRRLGFYGIALDELEGAKEFLCTTRTLMDDANASVWVTPQGEFTDVRASTKIEPGLPHLLSKLDHGTAVSLAIEYTHWHERDPEALLRMGPPIDLATTHLTKGGWTRRLSAEMSENQFRLTLLSLARDPSPFADLVKGTPGVAGLYDGMRQVRSLVTGQRLDPSHQQFSDRRRVA